MLLKGKITNPFAKTYSKQEKRIFRFLVRNSIFSRLTEGELAEFLPFLYVRHYRKGEVIFFRGDPSQAFYIINQGEISLTIDVADKFEELTKLKESHSFGENALLESTNRIYNAICISDRCEIYVIPTTNIIDIFNENIQIKAKMMTALAEYYDQYTASLFKAYQESFGFFDLGMAFSRK